MAEPPLDAASAYHQLSCHGWFDEPAIAASPPEVPRPAPPVPDIPGLLVAALSERRSQRDFDAVALDQEKLRSLLWATYGRIPSTDFERRSVPSAGGLYPLELWVVALRVAGMERGIYCYHGAENLVERRLDLAMPDSLRDWLLARQIDLEGAAATVFLVGDLEPLMSRYGERGYRYLLLEAGHAAQNLCLAATALGIPHVPVGGFDDARVSAGLGVNGRRLPLYSVVLGGG